MPRPEWNDLAAIHRSFGPDITRAVTEALNRLAEPSEEVRQLLIAGRVEQALDRLPWVDAMTALERRVYRIALTVQAKAAQDAMRRQNLEYRFDLTNPHAIRAAQNQAGNLIREVTTETKLAVRDIVVRGQRDGVPVTEQANLIRQHVGLTRRQATALYNFRRNLEERALRPERIERMVERKREQGVRYRARNIARTETIAAANQGTQEVWRQGVEQGFIPRDAKRVWVASPDACEICRPMNGQTVGLEQEFRPGAVRLKSGILKRPAGVLTPPVHPQCRCSLSLEIAA